MRFALKVKEEYHKYKRWHGVSGYSRSFQRPSQLVMLLSNALSIKKSFASHISSKTLAQHNLTCLYHFNQIEQT